MEILQGVWKQHLRPRAVVGYGFKIFLPSPRNYVTRSPGSNCKPIARSKPIGHFYGRAISFLAFLMRINLVPSLRSSARRRGEESGHEIKCEEALNIDDRFSFRSLLFTAVKDDEC